MTSAPETEFVDIGGGRPALTCQGEGIPAVVLEGGRGFDCRLRRRMLPEVASFTRVCAYDRARLGKSDPVP